MTIIHSNKFQQRQEQQQQFLLLLSSSSSSSRFYNNHNNNKNVLKKRRTFVAIPLMIVYSFLVLFLLLMMMDLTNAEHKVPTKKAIPPKMDPPPMLPEITDKVFVTIEIDGHVIGDIEFGLFGNNSPNAVTNFLELITCKNNHIGQLSKKPLCYKGSTIHRVIPNFAFQGGDVTHFDGTGGESIYGGKFVVEFKELIKFTRKRLLANAGGAGGSYGSSANASETNTFGSQFFVTTVKTQWLTGKYTPFGLVLNDENDAITQIEQVGTYGGKPKAIIKIIDSGIRSLTEDDKKPHY